MTRSRLRSLLSVGLLAAAGAAVAAEEEPAAAPAFAASVDVELVTVHAWVADRAGRPVTGLGASDFRLLHDGEPIAVTHFAEVRGGTVAPPATAAPSAGSAPAAEAPGAPGHLVLYFDQLQLQPGDYGPLLQGVAELLRTDAVPAERVMVMRQDRDLHIEAPFGSSREALDAALARVAGSRVPGDPTDGEQLVDALSLAWQESEELTGARSRIVAAAPGGERAAGGGPRAAVGGAGSGGGGGLGPDTCDLFADRVAGTVEAWARERNDRTASTVRHLRQTGAILAGLPGVKTLVYLSNALETEPTSPLVAAIGALCPGQSLDIARQETSHDMLALTRHLNSNQVTVFALQASGLRGAESSAAGRRTFGGARVGRFGSAFESAHRISQRRGMGLLADETGGRLVVNQNDLGDELAGVARDMGSYYSLAYQPPRDGRGASEHRIEVALADGSRQVRYRRGYREKDGEQRLRELLEGVLYLGLAANPLQVRLGAGEVERRGERYVLPLHMFVPVERLAFLGPEGAPVAELRLQVLARNAASPRQEWKARSFRVLRPAHGAGAADLGVELELDPGTNVVAVAVRDEGTRVTSLVSTTLEIGR